MFDAGWSSQKDQTIEATKIISNLHLNLNKST